MVEELAEEGHAGRVCGVVPVVRAEFRVGDQARRTLVQRVLRVEQAAWCAELGERRLHVVGRLGERGQAVEDSREAIRSSALGDLLRIEELRGGIRGAECGRAGSARGGANTGQESSAADALC